MTVDSERLRRLGVLAALYFSQGVPYGFFATALPVLMRAQGRSLQEVGLSSLLLAPWGLKIFVAPFVDQHAHHHQGRRRSIILVLQLLTVLSVLCLAWLVGDEMPLLWMAAAVVGTAALSATQDTATDGLAVSLLRDADRGLGNAIQVGGYRLGMIFGGGGLLYIYSHSGAKTCFLAMAASLVLATIPILLFREPAAILTTKTAWGAVRGLLARPRIGWFLLAICMYKFGDAVGSPMVKPLLIDRGYQLDDISRVVGTWGSFLALVGAFLGGVLVSRHRITALWTSAALHALSLALYAKVPAHLLSFVTMAEHLTGSLSTVALFTVMMDQSDPKRGATDYTAYATTLVAMGAIANVASGFLAQRLGYETHFVLSAVLCLIGAVSLVAWLRTNDNVRVA